MNKLDISSTNSFKELEENISNKTNSLMNEYNIPGAAIAFIKDGKIDYIKGFGLSDKEKGTKVDRNTVFQVASNSKTVSAWSVLKLVSDGKLDLDANVDKYLTRWKIPKSKYGDVSITLRELLSHTAGLSQGAYIGYSIDEKLPTLEESLSGATAGTSGLHLIMKPGTKYKYSGGGYTLAQLIVEETTGLPYAKFARENVLRPLSMNDSDFEWNPQMKTKIAKAYDSFGRSLPQYVFTEECAAGLYTTAADFAKFVAANINIMKGSSDYILNNDALSEMLTPIKNDYGLGYIIKKLPDNTKLVYHGGTNRGWRSQYAFLPDKGDGIVILTNSDNGAQLHMDLLCMWTKYETGYYPLFYIKNITLRALVKSIACTLFLLLLMLIFKFKNKTGPKPSIKPSTILPFEIIKCVVFELFVILWWLVFYTGVFSGGWELNSLMPAGFYWLTICVLCYGLYFIAKCFVEKIVKQKITKFTQNV
ncbi:serine hydrolase domain-containing protein [Acetivibrio cellulolyticus]